MSERMTVGQIYPVVVGRPATANRLTDKQRPSSSFETVLSGELVKFSHHAEERLKQRGIHFKPEQLDKINTAINKAAGKGAKDSLMLMGDTALIVNIKSRTVITALNGSSMKDNVFTQIDSAMIIS